MKQVCTAVVVVLVLVFGCSQTARESEGEKGAITDPEIVARIGQDLVYGKDIEMVLSQMPAQVQKRYTPSQVRREILDGFISMKMLANEARKRGIDKEEEVMHRLEYIIDQVLAKQLEMELKKDIIITDGDIEHFYQNNLERFVMPERIRARHILVDSEDRARGLLQEIREGADFAELAQRESSCPSASRGGDLGWFSTGKMDPLFEQAAFALEKGQLSEVVKSASGYHLIVVEDRKPARERTLDQVKTSIQRALEKERLQKAVDGLKETLRSEMSVVVNEEYFQAFENGSEEKRVEEESELSRDQ